MHEWHLSFYDIPQSNLLISDNCFLLFLYQIIIIINNNLTLKTQLLVILIVLISLRILIINIKNILNILINSQKNFRLLFANFVTIF